MYAERASRPGRPPVPPRGRPAERPRRDPRDLDDHARPRRAPRDEEHDRPRRPAREDHYARPSERVTGDGRRAAARSAEARPSARGRTAAVESGRFRGAVAVLGMFLVTLAGAGIDSYVGIGLGLITQVALTGSTVLAALSVRRRDLLSVVVAPPLVFIGVAALNIALAPSASFSLPTVATLLIRGFPTMAIATAAAVVVALARLIARR
ncbi:DUF6542 domain-containing protein [Blastococcus sp. TF02A-30]|uniref:DUF6542 domain-containing protein n=1 Tax=Blastococcus sp. TF02A-30 TaxID=2250580 RepID=UPI000DE9F84E|nr:DUF6542 domain-containing protein [Blastococcus sp. TF02A-30]RBY89514.1 hypothetical protein DQ241_08685 [Blastococcus sp. TF02A-30]